MTRQSQYNITPFTVSTTNTIASIAISTINLTLNTSATFSVQLFDSSGNIVGARIVVLSGDDYANWDRDDDYVIECIANQLGSSYTPPVVEPPVVEPPVVEPPVVEPPVVEPPVVEPS
jgi:hypothetical protein